MNSLLREWTKCSRNTALPIHSDCTNADPLQRLKSRKPTWKLAGKLITEKFDLMSKWTEDWRSNNIDSNHLSDQPMMQPPGFNLTGRQWIVLDRLRTGHGRLKNKISIYNHPSLIYITHLQLF